LTKSTLLTRLVIN